jgi:hypothetical protein
MRKGLRPRNRDIIKRYYKMACELSRRYIEYPEPDRSNHKPNFYSGPNKEYVDIGWNDGVLSDGRPFRVEYWCWEDVSILTYFMSTRGIEDVTDNFFRELLTEEGLISFSTEKPTLRAKKIKDGAGNEMWSVNVAVGNQDELFIGETVFIRRYKNLE